MRTFNLHLVNGEILTFDTEGLKCKLCEEGYMILTKDNRKFNIFKSSVLYTEEKDEIDLDKRI